jgi:hypothetical protein
MGATVHASDAPHAIVLDRITYRLPQDWINKTANTGQNRLECMDGHDCGKGTGQSLDIKKLCPDGATPACLRMLKERYDLDLLAEEAKYADPDRAGNDGNSGDREANQFLYEYMKSYDPDSGASEGTPQTRPGAPPSTRSAGGQGGARINPSLAYARKVFPGNPDTIGTIVASSPFLNSPGPAGNAAPSGQRHLPNIGPKAIKDFNDHAPSGRHIFDGMPDNPETKP